MGLLLIFALAQQLSSGPFDPDSPVFPIGLTCREAWVIETNAGAKPLREGPYDPRRGANVVVRPYLGFKASIIYMCNSERLDWRIITVDLDSQELVQELVNLHVKAMTEHFGAACWDPNKLSDEQRGLLPNGVPTASLMSRRMVWNINNDRVGSITIPNAPLKSGLWRVLIDAGLPPSESHAGYAAAKAWGLGNCRRGDVS